MHHHAVRLLLPAVLGVAPWVLAAQMPLRTQFRVQSFTTADGLPSNAVSDLAESRAGYLWIAAGGMLVRFDGYEFRTQRLGNTPELSRRINGVLVGRGDTLWVVVDEANSVIALVNGHATAVVPPGPPGYHIGQSATGALYRLGPDSVYLLRPGDERARSSTGRPDITGIPHWRDRDGTTWVRVRTTVTSVPVVGAPAAAGKRGPPPLLVTAPSSGETYEIRLRGGRRQVVTPEGSVIAEFTDKVGWYARLIDRHGRLWVGSADSVEVYARGSVVPVAKLTMPGELMIEARDGCIWTMQNGVHRACEVAFQAIQHPPVPGSSQLIRLVATGPGESMLMIDDSRTLLSASKDAFRMLTRRTRDYAGVIHAVTDSRGTIWYSSTDGYRGRLTSGDSIGFGIAAVLATAVQAGSPPVLWFADATHIHRAEPYAAAGPRITHSIPHHATWVKAISVGRDGATWAIVATKEEHRVLRIDGGRTTTFTVADGLPSTPLRTIDAEDRRTAWIGTYGDGLVRIRDGKARAVRESDGLSENVVTGVLEDSAANFWMGGNRGIHRVARSQVEAFLDGRISRVHGTTYDRGDGIPDPETSGAPGAPDAGGRFWFPTLKGAVAVDPRLAITLDTTPPMVHVLSITSDRDSIRLDERAPTSDVPLRLSLDARRLTIGFTGISLRNPVGVRYEYRVDGVDSRWIYAGAIRTATYSSIAPGSYTFRVRAVSGTGVASRTEATLRLVVPPHFYETRTFLASAILAAVGLLWLAFQRRMQAAQRVAAALEQEVAERTSDLSSALTTVAEQAAALRTLDEAKSRFFANVSHEFRTPLTLILGPAEDLMNGRAGTITAPARRRLLTIVANSRRLVQLVEQLLDVTRLESGKLQLHAAVQDLVALVRRMADSFGSLAAHRDIAFRLSCPVAGLYVSFDTDQMEKIITNLVGNALKFTPPGGSVELVVRVDSANGGYVVLEVRDSGPGIALHHQPHVFDRFYQVDDSSSRAHEGVGIGLALTKELVELHGGTIALHSVPGEGCTFTVRLPSAGARPSSAASGPHEIPRSLPRSPETVPNATRSTRRTPATGIGPEPSRDVLTVLIVEDNSELLDYLADHMAQRFRVLSAPNGVRGLEMAREHVPDLIVSDVMMPLMDGQALCEAIREDPEIDFIPVILLTAKASRESRLAGLTGGADDYLTKPVDLAELMIRADNLIASRRRVRERFEALRQPLPAMELPFRAAPRDASAEAMLKRFHAALSEHLSDPEFQVEEMAAAMGMSRTTLYRNLREHLGKSPMDAFWEYRLAQAAQWLEATAITVSEVAYGVGFRSVPHFCTRFREQYGETPSAYRQRRAAAHHEA